MDTNPHNLRLLSMMAVFAAVFSWIVLFWFFLPLSIVMIVWGFIEYSKNGGPKMHYYALYAAILILLIRIPLYFLLKSIPIAG